MDVVLLDCGLPEALCPVYKKGGGVARALLPFYAPQNPNFLKPFAHSLAVLVLSALEIWPASSKLHAAVDGT
jgi:hypothetical protein